MEAREGGGRKREILPAMEAQEGGREKGHHRRKILPYYQQGITILLTMEAREGG